MAKESKDKSSNKNRGGVGNNGCANVIYGLGLVGAVVYYFQQASAFSEYLTGFLKALVWPAFLIYRVMESLGM